MNRDEAIRKLLYCLKNPLVLMSVPDREEAMQIATSLDIRASELLTALLNKSRGA